jgi:hypothetical protein
LLVYRQYAFVFWDFFDGVYYTGLRSIICEATTPPIIGQYTFGDDYANIPVSVPCNSVNAYKTANYWKNFTNFIGMSDTTFIFDTICQGTIYIGNGFTVNDSAGVYCRTYITANNCDSVICLTLSEYPVVPITNYSAAICQGETYNFNGKLLTVPNVYYDTLSSIFGCDSIIELTLIVNPVPPVTQVFDSIFAGDSYDFNGKLLTVPNVYYDTLSSVFGCDSIIELTLTTVTSIGIDELSVISYQLSVYPNPTDGQLKVGIAGQARNDAEGSSRHSERSEESLAIYDIVGCNVGTYCIRPENDETTIDISHLSNGIYFLKINNNKLIKIVKN